MLLINPLRDVGGGGCAHETLICLQSLMPCFDLCSRSAGMFVVELHHITCTRPAATHACKSMHGMHVCDLTAAVPGILVTSCE